jgi:hypothetical protein
MLISMGSTNGSIEGVEWAGGPALIVATHVDVDNEGGR